MPDTTDHPTTNEIQYIPITTEDAVQAVRNGAWLFRAEIPDFRALLEGIADETDDEFKPIPFRCVGCSILSTACAGMQIPNKIDCSPPRRKYGDDAYATIFQQNVDFSESVFCQTAKWDYVTFLQEVNCGSTRFAQEVGFRQVRFASDAEFGSTRFEECVIFRDAKFEKFADFFGAAFVKSASMHDITFIQDADFSDVVFGQIANFWNTIFGRDANFQQARFTQEAWFLETCFCREATFYQCTFCKGINFQNAKFLDWIDLSETDLLGIVDFAGAYFEKKMALDLDNVKIHDNTHIRLGIAQIGKRKTTLLRGECSGDPQSLATVASQYNILRNNFRKLPSMEEEEDRCHYKYKDLTRRAAVAKPLRLLWWWKLWDWAVMKWCLGYGIYTKRILFTAIGVIVGFAVLYAAVAGDGTIKNYYEPPVTEHMTHFNALYFSTITFTTIGYGDYAPLGWLRMFAGAEGLLGLILMSVFTVSFARKLIR